MLYFYKHVDHDMDKMQKFIDFIFKNVWCKAPDGLEFSVELFESLPELKSIVSKAGYGIKAPESGKNFFNSVKDIYNLFAILGTDDIARITQWYTYNNDIEAACANTQINMVRYKELCRAYPELGSALKKFFTNLWDHDALNIKAFKDIIHTKGEHFTKFREVNKNYICPFCGIERMKNMYDTAREAYDHYLPKSLYPFNSINFLNLVPACHACNSDYKLTNDPLYKGDNRRKAFFPFAINNPQIKVSITFSHSDLSKITPQDVTIAYGPNAEQEEITTWREVYKIDERYKAVCCGSEGKEWLQQILDEWEEHRGDPQDDGRTPDKFMERLEKDYQRNPFAETRFLKKAYLEACREKGLFSTPQPA